MGSAIRFVAIAVSVVVVLGFALFAVDEMDRGSKTQQQRLERELGSSSAPVDLIAPSAEEERVREQQNGAVHELVDDANDILLAPFVDLVDSSSAWVNHGVPALLALLLYGVGLGFLANMLPRQRAHADDWRAAQP